MQRRQFLGLSMAAAAALAGAPAFAKSPVNMNNRGLAIKGYDPVAYFTQGSAVRGQPQFVYYWMHAEWRFASARNRDLFAARPTQFAPKYGGYCAFGVAQGIKVDIDPDAWKIVGGHLYLNRDPVVHRAWQQDVPHYIALGDEVWEEIKLD